MSVNIAHALRMGILALVWGSTFLWIDLALGAGLRPTHITFGRCVIGALTLLAACRFTGLSLPRGRGVWRDLLIAAALCNTIPFLLFSLGQRSVDSGIAGILNATTPLCALALGLLLGTDRHRPLTHYLGLGIGAVGLALIFTPWRQDGLLSWGAVLILGAAASYAGAFAFMGRRLTGRGIPSLALAAAQLMVATGYSALLALVDFQPVRTDWTGLATLVPLGVLCTAVTFALTYRLITDEGATNTAIVGYLLPVVALSLGAFVLAEPLTWTTVMGMLIVLTGVALTHRRARAPQPVGTRS